MANDNPLGKKTAYVSTYTPSLLYPIPRTKGRRIIGVPAVLPFKGIDIWNAFEISWLNNKGKPVIAIGRFDIPCDSENIIESKSLKLYLTSFNNSKFDSIAAVEEIIARDMSEHLGAVANVSLQPLNDLDGEKISHLKGDCLDDLDIECDTYEITPEYLTTTSNGSVEETLYSDLLKSNCLVTGQPDWGSVQIHYRGKKIDREGLLKYIVSYRNINEFGEQCTERLFMDIMQRCAPESLTVYTRYTRRGGLDINAIRSTEDVNKINNTRLVRQ
tara:strand:- start:4195 stop:5013 length:819 start_codon:yes stop_codon:yes gene_type:complete